ncbi:SPOR domain-containing protein [candidate division KSB1 bacterium]|nr:SPOR domain-containing protein [candidate division KSB1 bacterium]
MSRYLLILCLFMVLMISCSLSQFGWQVEPDTEAKPDEKELVEDFDPLTMNDEEIIVEPLPEQTSVASDEPVLASSTISNVSTNQVDNGEEVLGWRVQLLSVSDEQSAREAKGRAMKRFNEGVYMILDGSSYKIRVGDCISEDDAKNLVTKAIQKGYPDAWKVVSRVSGNSNPSENP